MTWWMISDYSNRVNKSPSSSQCFYNNHQTVIKTKFPETKNILHWVHFNAETLGGHFISFHFKFSFQIFISFHFISFQIFIWIPSKVQRNNFYHFCCFAILLSTLFWLLLKWHSEEVSSETENGISKFRRRMRRFGWMQYQLNTHCQHNNGLYASQFEIKV